MDHYNNRACSKQTVSMVICQVSRLNKAVRTCEHDKLHIIVSFSVLFLLFCSFARQILGSGAIFFLSFWH